MEEIEDPDDSVHQWIKGQDRDCVCVFNIQP